MIVTLRLLTLVSIGVAVFLFVGEAAWAVQHGLYRMFALRDVMDALALGALAAKAGGSGDGYVSQALNTAIDAPLWVYLLLLYGLGFCASNILGRSGEWRLRWELARLSRSA